MVVPEKVADLIAGILSTWVCISYLVYIPMHSFYWIQRSCEGIGEDDWFEMVQEA